MQIGLMLCIYILNALIVAIVLFWALLSDRSTPNNHRASWLVISIASVFWFVALPLSVIEILRRAVQQRRTLPDRNNSHKYLG